ncbi:hypothetical protein SAMN05421539_102375 [Jannaschia seohaensis]|uniref:Uncharacterized protein n=1 Tax=Jannaschia seohaensis TaxID=475081 RepID=A0A2Y9ABH8_9RHOB|nr:hypothetical protein BCF38_102375 [Jannaschia seohaensis]SSA41535.1 hypothetical protein SAMN05421539_102375 [Jannaschia seohaensis]
MSRAMPRRPTLARLRALPALSAQMVADLTERVRP